MGSSSFERAVRQDATADAYVATPTERGFWSLAALAPGHGAGNEGLVIELFGALDEAALAEAFDVLESRYDAWRTRYALDGEALRATVRPPRRGLMRTANLGAVPAEDRDAKIAEETAACLAVPFDLAREAPIRVTLLRLAADHHALVLVTHHVAGDGTSFLALMPRQLAAVYDALRGGGPLPPPSPSYAAFARAEHERLASDAGDVARRFWSRELADAPPPLELPTDHRRLGVRSLRGARVDRTLSADATDRLREAAAQADVRLIDLLLATFAVLLRRLSGADDVSVGTSHANRREPERALVYGCLVRTVPVRCAMNGAATVAELARRIRARRSAAFQHLEDVVDEVIAQRAATDPSRHGGYQVVLNYMPFSERAAGFAELESRLSRPDPGWTTTDLGLDVIDDGAALRCVLERDAALFDEATARAWLEAFVAGLEALPASLDAPIDALSLASTAGCEELARLGDGGGPAPRAITLVDVLARQVEATPSATALVHGRRSVSYASLWRRAGGLAGRLAVLPGDGALVGVAVDDPLLSVVAMLGALRAGLAYVPLDPALPAARLARMLEDARPRAVITDGAAPLPAGVRTVDVEATGPTPSAPATRPEDPAYVIFTSGSSGRPKGVVVRHANVVHQLDARCAFYGAPPERTVTAHSFAFDSAVAGLYWTLATGGALVLLDADERRDPAALRACIASHRVRTLDVPPALFREVLAEGADGLESLRCVIVGGEAVPISLARRHRATLPDARLFDEYGPTEATVFATVHEVDDDAADAVPIGRPIHRVRVRVVDAAGRAVPRGGLGELWIGGAGVAQGYLDPAETRERFVEDAELGRVYRTGDRVRWDGQGRLAFHGRLDAQVQVRGHRVEPGEIEAALEALADVSQAAVVARQADETVRLDAYVVARAGARPRPGALRAALRAELPEPMIPATVTLLDALPRAASGKIDPDQLPDPTTVDTGPAPPPTEWRTEPRTQAEETIAAAFARALGVASIGVHEAFFDRGGTSIAAVRVLSELHRELGLRVPLSAFVRVPTPAGLAAMLHDEGLLEEEPLVVVVRAGSSRPPFWLVHPVGGHVVFAERIARRWSEAQPLYGIQARGLDGRRPPIRTMDEMASLYVTLIRERQPEGPYYLGGSSQGGLVALEVAQRLLAAGERVAMLAMFDCWPPGMPRPVGAARRLLDHVEQLRARTWRQRAAYVTDKARRRLGKLQEEWREYRFAEDGDEGEVFDTLLEVQRANEAVVDGYTPRPYPGVLTVIRAARVPKHSGYQFDDPTCGWAPYAIGGLELGEIDAAHHQMLDEPYVGALASLLERRLRRAQRAEAARVSRR